MTGQHIGLVSVGDAVEQQLNTIVAVHIAGGVSTEQNIWRDISGPVCYPRRN